MLDCLALKDSCIYGAWDWVYENWSWGFFIAVFSLLFTAKALKKTDKSNKLAGYSLELTRKSTSIADASLIVAEESLKAAKKSIDTSIDIYNKQKKDSDTQKKADRLNTIKGILDVAGKEAFMVLQYLIFLIELQDLTRKAKSINLEYSERGEWNCVYFNMENNEILKTGQIPYIPKYFSHEVLIASAVSCPNLFSMLLNLNGQMSVVEKNITMLMRDIKNGDIDALGHYLNYYIPRDGKNLFIQSMLDETLCFEEQMKDYNGYLEVKNKIMRTFF